MTEQRPHDRLFALATGLIAPRCLHVVADLGVADHIAEEGVPLAALALTCEVDAEALERMLHLLAAHGVFTPRDGGWAHTASSRLLRSDHPMSMRAYVRMNGLSLWREISAGYEYSLRTGMPFGETVHPQGPWGYLRDHPEQAEIFNQGMTAKAAGDTAAVLGAYDFARFDTIADIGGGRGHLLQSMLDAAPNARGVLFDLPSVIAGADLDHPHMTRQAGDFFVDALPAADAYVLMEVVHDWGDQQAVDILRAVREAAKHNATLLIIEGLLDSQRADPVALSLDIIMLTAVGGRERTPDQMAALLQQAGFGLARVIDTGSRMRIVEANVV